MCGLSEASDTLEQNTPARISFRSGNPTIRCHCCLSSTWTGGFEGQRSLARASLFRFQTANCGRAWGITCRLHRKGFVVCQHHEWGDARKKRRRDRWKMDSAFIHRQPSQGQGRAKVEVAKEAHTYLYPYSGDRGGHFKATIFRNSRP